ncbi:MAG: zf-TFIIB domain-containing protein [Jaaginema sp. PMC 1079.18]|nr:zf-TFIIB domain-containing protein [Jaaginema sp. PMC 1080.18]MEC4852929.1 zf-TFIIB domain-containing protein [Jaaginema sp. PMC 1079.18]MEC4865236.1 zf-TFIIB domain-containing protein [Jaaginema sp. PMC 1078.18]
MKCPKCSQAPLGNLEISPNLIAQYCVECKGQWLSGENYEAWKAQQPSDSAPAIPVGLDITFGRSELDTRAALCPECSRYLSRAQVKIETPFFIDRCQQCGGIWCDYGEWDALTQLGLNTCIEQLFEPRWQNRIRQQQQRYSEHQAMVEKMGTALADRIFALAEDLAEHPHGEYALAYLMRKVVYIKEK